MNALKKILMASAVTFGLLAGHTAQAGIPVIDGANLAQSIQQVWAWAQQYQQMIDQIQNQVEQIRQLEQQLESMNGIRNMGDLVNNPASRNYLPADYATMLNSGVSGWASIAAAAKRFDESLSTLDPSSDTAKDFQALRKQAAINRASAEAAYNAASQRFNDIQVLLNKVNAAPQAKDIADLQARLMAEQVMVQNEANKLEANRQLVEAQNLIANQQANEYERQFLLTR